MPHLAELLNEITATVEVTRALDLRPYENAEPSRVRDELSPQIESLLDHSIELLDELVGVAEDLGIRRSDQAAESVSTTDSVFLRSIDELMTGEGGRQLEDLVFLARFELVGRRERLRSEAQSERSDDLLSLCDACRRKILKTLTAVENALCTAANLKPGLDYRTELNMSLQIRRVISRCRRRLFAADETTPENVEARLLTAATVIAWLNGHEIYPDLRLTDRLELRGFQQRLIAWKTQDATDRRAGLRLWQDLEVFCSILRKVNHRTELMDHDLRLALEADQVLFGGHTPPARVPLDLLERLGRLFGRDDAVDKLLSSDEASDAAAWAKPLEYLIETLSPTPSQEDREWKRGDTHELYPNQYIPPAP